VLEHEVAQKVALKPSRGSLRDRRQPVAIPNAASP